jgi:ribosomal protein S18 acetylase RimI-like enzyme
MAVEVRPLRKDELEAALPLIAGYQRFYEAEPNDDRNRGFFARFIEPSDQGLLLGAWVDGELVGFATLYWFHSSTQARDSVLMNDLFVAEGVRGGGVGRALIDACMAVTRERGAAHLEWYTAPDNRTAQRLYDAYPGSEQSTWFSYEVEA